MFYSQFILAKKGPLGTIWIAAHLERKLRKNQVADTDIGVSVDSILFPEVPIALRLSSHLLLGVVRIYSRKVNYLFDDCSEALLKIKQAFRSTAVDLPPEESTAPYHSITLPETFDLDDFELPDNEIFQGNYVDHHVSTKEQITLQDTMEGVVYSTSQFGLDERFGDGDTSQIGLDLDEELLLNKVVAPGHDGVSDADPQMPVQSETTEIKYESNEVITETSEAIHMNGGGNQVYINTPSISN
jgi:cohesin complex subunit SCC1